MKIFVKVKPNTSQEKIAQKDKRHFEVWVKEPAIEHKANKVALKIISKYFNIPLSEIKIISGSKSKEKIIQINRDLFICGHPKSTR